MAARQSYQRGKHISNTCRIISTLMAHSRGIGMDELVEITSICRRSLYRYLQAIVAEFPIYTEKHGRRVKYRWLEG